MTIIRLATENDAADILSIYSPYIENTSLTFETEVPSLQSFAERIKKYLELWPWLVCEVDGQIAGYAYATRHRERVAYQWSVESSVYIPEKFQKRNIARALYSALIEILKNQGFRNVYAVINLPNDKSVSFHEKCGFEYFTTFEKVGYKLGAWKNVGWWRLSINEYGMEPAPPVKFEDINKGFLKNIFADKARIIKDDKL
jgi:phosphinothricin acetyltransferase